MILFSVIHKHGVIIREAPFREMAKPRSLRPAFDALDLGERAGAFTRIDAAATRAEITAIYRFAKLEFGVGQFFGLVRRALGLQAARNA